MLEVYGTEDQVMEYYGTPESPGGHFPFNFRFITDLNGSSTAVDFARVLNNYLEHVSLADDRVPNWVVRYFAISLFFLFFLHYFYFYIMLMDTRIKFC